jgi:hypothetical protein
MIVRKVRRENKIHPIKITRVEFDIAKKLGIKLEDFVKEYLAIIAKQRRWKWFFEKKASEK